MKIINFVSEEDILNIKKFGIYKISTNIHEDQCYIGSTTRNFAYRWRQHLYKLRTNSHENIILQRIVNKYGLNCLIIEIIEIIENKEEILNREQYWIDFYDSYNKGFNCTPKAGNSIGVKRREETNALFYKEVSQYNLNGNFIKTFKSMKEAAKETNTDYVTLSNACSQRTKTKTANGFQWKLGNNINPIPPTEIKKTTIVKQYDINDNFIKDFLSIKEAAKSVLGSPKNLLYALKKKNGIYLDYKWKQVK